MVTRFNTPEGALEAAHRLGWTVIRHHRAWHLVRGLRRIVVADLTDIKPCDLAKDKEVNDV